MQGNLNMASGDVKWFRDLANIWQFIKMLNIQPRNSTKNLPKRNKNVSPHKYMFVHVCRSIIHNSQTENNPTADEQCTKYDISI